MNIGKVLTVHNKGEVSPYDNEDFKIISEEVWPSVRHKNIRMIIQDMPPFTENNIEFEKEEIKDERR